MVRDQLSVSRGGDRCNNSTGRSRPPGPCGKPTLSGAVAPGRLRNRCVQWLRTVSLVVLVCVRVAKPTGPSTMQPCVPCVPCSSQLCQICPGLPRKVCIATIGVPLDFRTTKKYGAVGTMELANPNQRLGLTWSIRWLFSMGKVGFCWCHNKCWCEFSSRVGYDTMSVSHTGQKGEDQSGRAWEELLRNQLTREQMRPDQTREQKRQRQPIEQAPCTTRARKDGNKNRNRLGETERRGPVVSQEPRLIETAAVLGWAQGRFGLVGVIDTRCVIDND